MTARSKKPPAPPPEEEKPTPMLRVALNPDDFRELLEQLDHWDHPVAHRLRMIYSKYSIKRMQG